MGSTLPISSILLDIQQALDRLAISLNHQQSSPVNPLSSHLSSLSLSSEAPPLPLNPIPPILAGSRKPVQPLPTLNPIPLPPLPGSSVPLATRYFSDIVCDSILSQPVNPTRSRSGCMPPENLKKSNQAQSITAQQAAQTLQRLRTLSQQCVVVCYHCGDRGHSTTSCRSSLVCFGCHKVGHRASDCLAITNPPLQSTPLLPPILPVPPPAPPSDLPPLAMLPPPSQTRLLEANTLPVSRFYATPGTIRLRKVSSSLTQGVWERLIFRLT